MHHLYEPFFRSYIFLAPSSCWRDICVSLMMGLLWGTISGTKSETWDRRKGVPVIEDGETIGKVVVISKVLSGGVHFVKVTSPDLI